MQNPRSSTYLADTYYCIDDGDMKLAGVAELHCPLRSIFVVLRSSFTTCVWTCASVTSLCPLMAVLESPEAPTLAKLGCHIHDITRRIQYDNIVALPGRPLLNAPVKAAG